MASVNLEFRVYMDPRFTVLGYLSGQTKYDAIGRMGAIWAHCIEKCQAVVPMVLVDVLTETKGYSRWVVEADLAESVDDERIRIKGTEGRIEYLERARVRQKIATEAAAKKRRSEKTPKQPILDPNSDPTLDPTLESSSTSASTSASKDKRSTSTLGTDQLWTFYADALKAKEVEPIHEGPKTKALLGRLLDAHGADKARRLIATYLSDSTPFVRDHAWSLGLLVNQQQKYVNKLSALKSEHSVLSFGEDE